MISEDDIMITVKIYEDEPYFESTKDAIKYMESTNYSHEVSVYDINDSRAYGKAMEIYKYIIEYNKGKPLNEQILPANPFACRGIVGCLGVQVYTIGLGTYKRNHDKIALFTGFNSDVLDLSKETANILPNKDAIVSLAIMGSML